MSARPLDTATAAAFQLSDLPLGFIIYLDILGDPLLTWTGLGDLAFAAAQTGDAQLDGNTFTGSGNIFEIGAMADSIGGSDVMTISLTGVDITLPLLRQLIYNRNRWQFRRRLPPAIRPAPTARADRRSQADAACIRTRPAAVRRLPALVIAPATLFGEDP